MIRSLYTAASGMGAQQRAVDVVSNNIANANTTGFKRSQADFEDLLYAQIERPGAARTAEQTAPTGLELGSGARLVSTTKVFQQGAIEQTGNTLDLAIDGDGFLSVTLPDQSIGYTRAGSLRVDPNGQLVDNRGNPLVDAIQIPPGTDVEIGSDGTVVGRDRITGAASQLGQIQLTSFTNPAGLESLGGNLYRETPASGGQTQGPPQQAGLGSLQQGALERSNVQVVDELVSLIDSQRAYEINTRAIRVGDEMLSGLNDLIR